MRRLALAASVCVMSPAATAQADGPGPVQLQQTLAAGATSSDRFVTANQGDVSRTTFLPASGAAPASVGAKLGRLPDPRDFGATGDSIRGQILISAAAGATQLTLVDLARTAGIAVQPGAMVLQQFVPTGTVVTAVTQNPASGSLPATTSVTLSNGLTSAVSTLITSQTYVDFATHDDTAAFLAAYAQARLSGQGMVHVSPGLYAFNSTVGPDPTVSWDFDNAMLTQNGAVLDGINYGLQRMPTDKLFMKTLSYPDNENDVVVDANFIATNSTHSYQKNALHLQVWDADPSCFQSTNGASCNGSDGYPDIGRGAVGLSIQAQAAPGNTSVSLFGQETLLTMPAGTDGATTTDEKSLVNNATRPAPYLGDIYNKFVMTVLSSGTTPATAGLRIGGVGMMQNGIWFDAGSMVENALVVGRDNGRASNGAGLGYSGYAWISNAGQVFGETAHFGGGASANATLPVGGVSVGSDAYGRMWLGDARTPAGNGTPVIEFHLPQGAASDLFAERLIATGTQAAPALVLQDAGANQLASMSIATGITGTRLVASATNGLVFTGGNSLGISLSQSGFDMIQELSGKAFAINTAGGYNATFNADGSTSFGGPVSMTAQDNIATAGTGQSNATALSRQVNRLTSCPAGTALMLPTGTAAGASLTLVVLNRSGGSCTIYPPAGGTIESGGQNVPVTIASGADSVFRSMSPSAWYQ